MRNEVKCSFVVIKGTAGQQNGGNLHLSGADSRLLTTMKRLHQQSPGQRAGSPNPPCGRDGHSEPHPGHWLLALLDSLCVCSLNSRVELKRKGWGGCCLL